MWRETDSGLLLPSTADYVNFTRGVEYQARFRTRLQDFRDMEESDPRHMRVYSVADPLTGRKLVGEWGEPIFVVVLEDTQDRGPKVYSLINVDPHGNERLTEGVVDMKLQYAADHPETLKGQCLVAYFGGGDGRLFADASSADQFMAKEGGEYAHRSGNYRLQIVDFQSGWAPLSGGGPGWRGLERVALVVRDRIRRHGGRLAMFASGHNSEVNRRNYIRLGMANVMRKSDEVALSAAHGRRIEQELTNAFRLQWNPRIFDDPDARPYLGTTGCFPLQTGTGRKRSDTAMQSDVDLIGRLFANEPQAPVLMFVFESLEKKLVGLEMDEDAKRLLTKRLVEGGDIMVESMKSAARYCKDFKGFDPYRQQIEYLTSPGNAWSGSNPMHKFADPGDDTDLALDRAAVAAFWQARDLRATLPYLMRYFSLSSGLPPSQQLGVEMILEVQHTGSAIQEAYRVRRIKTRDAIAVQLAGYDLAFKSGALEWVGAEDFVGLDRDIAASIRYAHSDALSCETALDMGMPSPAP